MINLFKKIKREINIFYKKDFPFRKQIKIRSVWMGNDDAGFFISPEFIDSQSIVYSFGIGEDISFDEEIIRTFNCKVFGFDPTPKSIYWIQNRKNPFAFTFYDFGIDDHDGFSTFYPPENSNFVSCSIAENEKTKDKSFQVPMKKLSSIVKLLNHSKIDILKLDIEGSEFKVIPELINSDISVRQILIEFHHRFIKDGLMEVAKIVKILNEDGFKIFAVSSTGQEISFIKP